MAFDDFQKERILFHIDFNPRAYGDDLHRTVTVDVTSPEVEKMTVGDLLLAPDEDCIFVEGVKLCTKLSILGECERAYQKISVDTIEDSLLVSKAGNVTLRSDELKARTKLYQAKVKSLKTILGFPSGDRVGF